MAVARTAKKAKRGRPPLPPEEKRLPSMGFRPSLTLRRALEDAISVSGRSLSQEIESRLERTFLSDDAKFDNFGGKEKYELTKLFAVGANLLEPRLREAVKKLQTAGRLPNTDAEELSEQTWANDWTYFQFAVAFWMQAAKQAHFEVPPGIEAFEAAFFGRGQPGSGSDDLNELGALLRDWVANEPEDQPPKK